MSFPAASSYAGQRRQPRPSLPSLRELTAGLQLAAKPICAKMDVLSGVAKNPKATFNAMARAIAMGEAVIADQGSSFNGYGDFGDFGSWWNPIDWVKSIGDVIGSAFSTIGGALADAAKGIANAAVVAWNAAKTGIATLNVLTADGRRRLFHTLVDIFIPPPLPPHYFLRRMDELVDCLLSKGHGFGKLQCIADWIVNSLKDMLTDPIMWLILGVVFNLSFGNVPGAVVGGIAGVVRLFADEIQRQNTFGSKTKYVAVFLKLLSASGDLLWIWQMGTGAFANPATYLILGAMLMQGSNEIPELGTVGQAMAQYSTILATIFGNVAAGITKLVDFIKSSDGSHLDLIKTVGDILSAIGGVFSAIGGIIQKIPLLGPLIADGLVFLGQKLKSLPAVIADVVNQAGAAAAAAARAAAQATQATIDAAVAAAKAVWQADYQKAMAAAVAAAKAAAEATAQGTINVLKAALQAAQDAAAAAQAALAAALAKLAKFSLPPSGWNPKWPWPPDSWPPSIDWPPQISLPSISIPKIAIPDFWPKNCPFPPTSWPPCGLQLPAPPPVAKPGPATAPPDQTAPTPASSFWHIVLGAGVGMLAAGPPGAIAGGVAAANLLKGVKVLPGGAQ